MNITLVYAPFCTPLSPPYALASLQFFLKHHLPTATITSYDANIAYHNLQFAHAKKDFLSILHPYDKEVYGEKITAYDHAFVADQAVQHKKILRDEQPDYFAVIVETILASKPDVVAFSVVFSSQSLYTFALIKALNERGITTVVGGPAVSEPVKKIATHHFCDHEQFLNYLQPTIFVDKSIQGLVDFSDFKKEDYFSSELVYPIKTSNTCYYKQCAFCTHHTNESFAIFPIENLRKSLQEVNAKHVFFIDDMIAKPRLLDIATMCQELTVTWICQLKPVKQLDKETLQQLVIGGLKIVLWGVESGCDRVLQKIRKGTNTADISIVLKNAKAVGIQNVAFILFGFPTETRDEFMQTLHFIEEHKDFLDLVSTSVFGLQKDSFVFDNPETFGITKITERKRTVLDPAYIYEVKEGLSQVEATVLRKKFRKQVRLLNNVPRMMNVFREHHLLLS